MSEQRPEQEQKEQEKTEHKKRGRKTKIPVEGASIEILEKPENAEKPQELSYNGAKEKLKQKRPMTDKQKENIQRLIELNKKRREEQKKADEEQAEKEGCYRIYYSN